MVLLTLQVFDNKMEEAQQEIRNTVTVNTSDLSTKNSDEKDGAKEGEKFNRRRGRSLSSSSSFNP